MPKRLHKMYTHNGRESIDGVVSVRINPHTHDVILELTRENTITMVIPLRAWHLMNADVLIQLADTES